MVSIHFERLFISSGKIHIALAAYFIVIVAMRVWLFPGVAEDDAEQFYYAQSWALGYKGSQPPLFTWFVKAAESILGVGVGALFAVKFVILFGFYVLSYLTARSIITDNMLAGVAALTPIALYYIGWDSVVNYSNSVALATAQAATLFAFFRLRNHPGVGSYVFLGLAIGCGLLSKYNFALSLLPMIVAGFLHPEIKRKILSPNIIITLCIVLVLIAPHGYWAATDIEGMTTVFVSSARPWQLSDDWLWGMVSGIGNLLVGVIDFTLPAGLIVVGIFARHLFIARDRGNATISYFEAYFCCYFITLILLVIGTQATDVQNHWLMGLLPFPLYIFTLLDQRAELISVRTRRVCDYTLHDFASDFGRPGGA